MRDIFPAGRNFFEFDFLWKYQVILKETFVMFAAVSLSTWHKPGSYHVTKGLLIFTIEYVCVSPEVETNFES